MCPQLDSTSTFSLLSIGPFYDLRSRGLLSLRLVRIPPLVSSEGCALNLTNENLLHILGLVLRPTSNPRMAEFVIGMCTGGLITLSLIAIIDVLDEE